jgi:hypothetical protein
MKIMICGSMHFAREMLKVQNVLEKLGHEVLIPCDTHECVENPDLNMDIEHCMITEIDKSCFTKVAQSEAILVLNYPKNNIKGYIGGATLMEIGLARYLDKKIFLLYDLPSEKELRYALEIKLTRPVILKGNLNNIDNRL